MGQKTKREQNKNNRVGGEIMTVSICAVCIIIALFGPLKHGGVTRTEIYFNNSFQNTHMKIVVPKETFIKYIIKLRFHTWQWVLWNRMKQSCRDFLFLNHYIPMEK